MKPSNSALALCAVLLISSANAQSIPIYNIDPAIDGTFVEPANNKTWGYSFYVKSPVVVTHLGWFDTNQDGLTHAHKIGIWKDTTGMTGWPYINGGTLVTSVTIPSGTSAELSSAWRRMAITPITLPVGGYSVGGENNSQSLDEMWYIHFLDLTASVVDPRITVGSFDYNISGPDGFNPPGISPSGWYALDGAEIGAMMFVVAIPEPSGKLLLMTAVAMIAVVHRKSDRR
jgi:hypothetical protein